MSTATTNTWRAYCDLVKWDWLREMKRKETIVTMTLFSLVTLMVFSFAIRPDSETGLKARAGILWVTFLFAGSIGIDRAFRGEGQSRVLQGLLLAPVGRATIYYARVTSTFLFVMVMELITFIAFCILYNIDMNLDTALKLGSGAVAATLGFVAAGVTLSAMTRAIRGGDVFLRLLLFPLLIPIFNAVVSYTNLVFNGRPLSSREIVILVAFDLVYVAAGQILFEVVVSDFDA